MASQQVDVIDLTSSPSSSGCSAAENRAHNISSPNTLIGLQQNLKKDKNDRASDQAEDNSWLLPKLLVKSAKSDNVRHQQNGMAHDNLKQVPVTRVDAHPRLSKNIMLNSLNMARLPATKTATEYARAKSTSIRASLEKLDDAESEWSDSEAEQTNSHHSHDRASPGTNGSYATAKSLQSPKRLLIDLKQKSSRTSSVSQSSIVASKDLHRPTSKGSVSTTTQSIKSSVRRNSIRSELARFSGPTSVESPRYNRQSVNGHSSMRHTLGSEGDAVDTKKVVSMESQRSSQTDHIIVAKAPSTRLQHPEEVSIREKAKINTNSPRPKPISVKDYKARLQQHLAQMQGDTQYVTQNLLRRAQESTKPCFEPFIQARSPFKDMKSIQCNSSVKNDINKFGHHIKGSHEKVTALSSYPYITFKQKIPSLPPYTTYIPVKRNILTEDNKQRTCFPAHNDDLQPDNEPKDYENLQDKITKNKEAYHRLNTLQDQARVHQAYVETWLAEIDCSTKAVLCYLLDETGRSAPEELPREHIDLWNLRTTYLEDNYYEIENDMDAVIREDTPFQQKPQQQWHDLFEELCQTNMPSGHEIAAACVACHIFQDTVDFSIFHVATALHEVIPKSPNLQSLSTYVDFGCFACKAHECPGHGEWLDKDDEGHVREKVNFRADSPDTTTEVSYRINEDAVVDLLGVDEDMIVRGRPWTRFRAGHSGYEDDQLCSEDCFWLAPARTTSLSIWSEADEKSFQMLRPAYEYDKRGPCFMAMGAVIRKSCREIFLKLLREPSRPNQWSSKIVNELNADKTTRLPRKTVEQWLENPNTKKAWEHDSRDPFYPCDHIGPCSEENGCSCVQEGIQCEKTCACASTCIRKNQGCKCHAKGKPCRTSTCDCRRLNRECDPDVCGTCGVDEVLDRAHHHDESILIGRCNNASIQRGVPKRTILGSSKLLGDGGKVGLGLYMGEECKKDDFVGEYRGETLSSWEADQRGTIYDQRQSSYLFTLNGVQVLDGTHIANKMRFINHQSSPMNNCGPKILFCNGTVRIGMFALREIAVGEELFFDYGAGFASKFDLIQINGDGSVSIERARPEDKTERTIERNVGHARSSQYQLKNKISRNGHRLGRPPKGSEKLETAFSSSPELSRASPSRKRRRDDRLQEQDFEAPSSDFEVDIESHVDEDSDDILPRRKRRRRRQSPINADVEDRIELEATNSHSRLRTRSSRRQPESSSRSNVSSQPAPSPVTNARASRRKDRSRDRSLASKTSTPSTSRPRTRVQQRREEVDSAPAESKPSDAENEEQETVRRSSRRRAEKQHFDETVIQMPSSRRQSRQTARKGVRR